MVLVPSVDLTKQLEPRFGLEIACPTFILRAGQGECLLVASFLPS